MTSGADLRQYKQTILQAAAANNVAGLRPYLEAETLQIDDVCNTEKQNLLHVAAFEGAEEAVALMLNYARVVKKVDTRDRANRTPLHLAAAVGYAGVIKRLVAAGAALDVRDEKGYTPLHLAVKFEWVEAVKALLDAGADPLSEDLEGNNAVDMANEKEDNEASLMMAAFAGRRRPATGLQGLRRCLVPMFRPPKPSCERGAVGEDRGGGAGRLGGSLSAGGGPEDPALTKAIAEACANRGAEEQDGAVIEWHGLEPVLVKKGAAAASCMGGARGNRGREDSPGAVTRQAVASSRGGGDELADFATFRLHMFFDDSVKRLEFEVEWKDEQPSAGAVKPNGEADKRGLVRGDRIIEIAGKRTGGKGREELLPLLKQRPLFLKVDREAEVANPREPRLELTLNGIGGADHGVEVTWRGQLSVVTAVRPQSKAWIAGLLEGDAIARVNGRDVAKGSKDSVASSLKERPQAVTVWRRPKGSDPAAPWSAKA